MTPSDIEAIRQRVENADRRQLSQGPEELVYARPADHLYAAIGCHDVPRLLAELDRRAELMRRAIDALREHAYYQAGEGGRDLCLVGQCECSVGETMLHKPDCLIERLRAVGK